MPHYEQDGTDTGIAMRATARGRDNTLVYMITAERAERPVKPVIERTACVLSVDAWRDSDGGWQWNNWYPRGRVSASFLDLTPRQMLRALREEGILSSESAGRIAMEDDGFNIVIMDKNSREPLYAIEYGPLYY